MTRVLGVDGCPRGWVVVALLDGVFAEARLVTEFSELVDDPAAIIGVDIPLGSVGGRRRADQEARARLGPRASSVFPAPPRDVLDERDHPAANAACRRRYGFGVTAQAWNLRDKILDAEPHWQASPDRIFEVHPELAFAALAGDVPRPHPKRTWAGARDRAALLTAAGIVLPDDVGTAGVAGPDDVLDAAAVAWSARRIDAGTACMVPTPPERDPAGRPITIAW